MIDRQIASYLCDTKDAEYVRLEFEQPSDFAASGGNVVYLDNLEVHYDGSKIEPITKTFRENEILFFEDLADRFNIRAFSWMASAASNPKLGINVNPDYVTQGDRSLRVDVTVNPNEAPERYPGLSVDGEYVTQFAWEDFKDDDTVSFDLFNDGLADKWISFEAAEIDKAQSLYWYKIEQLAAAGQWTTFSLRVGDMRAAWESKGGEFKNVNTFRINYLNEYAGETYSMYIDNFRFNLAG
jgi:hypothetical protein